MQEEDEAMENILQVGVGWGRVGVCPSLLGRAGRDGQSSSSPTVRVRSPGMAEQRGKAFDPNQK